MFNTEVIMPLDVSDVKQGGVDVSLYNVAELLELRARIDAALPPLAMKDIDLEKELVIQFYVTKQLQTDTLNDQKADPGKKASVVGACLAMLKEMTKTQIELHTAERFKAIEGLMIRAMKTLPKETVDKFLKDYESLTF